VAATECPLLAQSGQSDRDRVCPLLDNSGQSRILARDGLVANDPKVLAKMNGWNAAEKTNVSGDLKRGVRLNVTYTVEPEPQEENPT
jgi:hypothetical protein